MSYNGFSNWETWNYALWLGNVEYHYLWLQDRLLVATKSYYEYADMVMWLAKSIEEYGLVGTDLSQDDMSKVDFHEIAQNELDEYLLGMEG